MRAWQATTLSPDLRVDVVARPEIRDAAALAAVERIWTEARRERPTLFDGRVFSADRISSGCIVGHWTQYKFGFAQLRQPSLFGALGIRAVAVNGVVRSPDGIVFGRRDSHAVYQPGMWQCPPAGSIERRDEVARVDLLSQVAAEFEEELGLAASEIASVRPLSAVEHPDTHVVDVGLAIDTARPAADIIAAQAGAPGREEYETIVVVPVEHLEAQLAAWGDLVVPPARSFLAVLLSGQRRDLAHEN